MTTTTWNPSDETGIDFSGGNLVATGHSFNFNAVRGTDAGHSTTGSEKIYFEVTCNSSFSDSRSIIGIQDDIGHLGGDFLQCSHFLGLNEAGATIGEQGIGLVSVAFGPINGQTFGIAVDTGGQKFWMTNDGVTWNSGGSNDPATGVSDISPASFTWSSNFSGSVLLPMANIVDTGASVTLNTGGSAFAYALPTGFVAWDAPPPLTGVWASTETTDIFAAIGYSGIPGIHGDLLVTEAKDVFAAAGYQPNSGFMQAFETADHFSAFGFQPLTGTFNVTEAPDRFHATGIGLGVDGVFITTEAVDIFSAIGNTPISGTFDTTEAADRFFAIGAGVTQVRRRRTLIVT